MHAQRTPLARFIDLSALWSLSLMIWFYVLLARLRQLYPALLLACACAAATLGLWALLRRALISRRRAALPEELVRQLCAHVALMPPDAALDALATWLRFSGTYPKCTRAGDALEAASHDGELITIALAQVWPDARAGTTELLAAWRRCGGDRSRTQPDAPRIAIAATASFTPEALSLARELGITTIAPEALATVMRAALPVCGEARRRKPRWVVLRTIVSRAHAGRFGAYALGLSVAGRLLGLSYFRAVGLICALVWLICAAQPRAARSDVWP